MKGFLILLLAAVFTGSAEAGSAAFSADGKTLFFLGRAEGQIWTLDVASGKTAVLPGWKDKAPVGLARDGEGQLLVATENAVWTLDGGQFRKTIEAEVPEQRENGEKIRPLDVRDITVNPATGALLVLAAASPQNESFTASDFLILRKGAKALGPVFARRIADMWAMAYDKDGMFFFGSQGDLWSGETQEVEENTEWYAAVVNGTRAAPLAYQQTDLSNMSNTIVREVAATNRWVYAVMGNRYEMFLARLPKSAVAWHESEEPPESKKSWFRLAEALNGAEVVAPLADGFPVSLCSAPDGESVVCQVSEEDSPVLRLFPDEGASRTLAPFPAGE